MLLRIVLWWTLASFVIGALWILVSMAARKVGTNWRRGGPPETLQVIPETAIPGEILLDDSDAPHHAPRL